MTEAPLSTIILHSASITIIILEIGLTLYRYYEKKSNQNQQAKNVVSNIGTQQQSMFPFDFKGVIFFKAKNKFEAIKKRNRFIEEQRLLQKTLDKKKRQKKN